MGVRTAVQPQQLGQIGGSVEIAADALADEVALTAERDDVRLAEGLVLVGLAEQHFHGRHAAEAQRVEDGDAVVGVASTMPSTRPGADWISSIKSPSWLDWKNSTSMPIWVQHSSR